MIYVLICTTWSKIYVDLYTVLVRESLVTSYFFLVSFEKFDILKGINGIVVLNTIFY